MDHDIIIVGAGPAGLSTGLHLAQLAPELAERTLILERARHPRPKLCAGGITPGGEAWLRKLGLDLSAVTSPFDVREAHFLFEGQGFVVRREPFLFRSSGATNSMPGWPARPASGDWRSRKIPRFGRYTASKTVSR